MSPLIIRSFLSLTWGPLHKAGLAKHINAEVVDVTMALVEAFKPNERQRKSAITIQQHDPIPLDRAEKIRD
jgi:hypothetical protein